MEAAAAAISISSSTDDLFNLIMNSASTSPFLLEPQPPQLPPQPPSVDHDDLTTKKAVQEQPRRSRRRRNNTDVVEARMKHITVERNRRKLMNHYLGVLRSLVPQSYLQRGDQASIVGGAIEYVKELEQLLHSLEAQKQIGNYGLEPQQQQPSFTWPTQSTLSSQIANYNKYTSKCKASMADIEVTLIQTHANIRILARKFLISRQLSKMVSSFTQALNLSILHLNITTLFESSLVLYSISAKVEEGCHLTSAEDIAGAIHNMFRIFELETQACFNF